MNADSLPDEHGQLTAKALKLVADVFDNDQVFRRLLQHPQIAARVAYERTRALRVGCSIRQDADPMRYIVSQDPEIMDLHLTPASEQWLQRAEKLMRNVKDDQRLQAEHKGVEGRSPRAEWERHAAEDVQFRCDIPDDEESEFLDASSH